MKSHSRSRPAAPAAILVFLQVEPGSIAVRNEVSGETLRFRCVGRA